MLGVRLDNKTEQRLARLAAETGRSKSHYARLAIQQFLEDRDDYLRGIAALERRDGRVSLDQIEAELGLER